MIALFLLLSFSLFKIISSDDCNYLTYRQNYAKNDHYNMEQRHNEFYSEVIKSDYENYRRVCEKLTEDFHSLMDAALSDQEFVLCEEIKQTFKFNVFSLDFDCAIPEDYKNDYISKEIYRGNLKQRCSEAFIDACIKPDLDYCKLTTTESLIACANKILHDECDDAVQYYKHFLKYVQKSWACSDSFIIEKKLE